MNKYYFEDSIYIVSERYFDYLDACEMLTGEENENFDFVEFDEAVAHYYNYKRAAVFHKK